MSVLLAFLGSYWKYILPLVLGIAIGASVGWKIQQWRFGGDRVKLNACISANAEKDNTIKMQQEEVAKCNKSCQERLKSKDATLKKMRDIDNLRGKDEKNPSSGDALLDALNGMYNDDKVH